MGCSPIIYYYSVLLGSSAVARPYGKTWTKKPVIYCDWSTGHRRHDRFDSSGIFFGCSGKGGCRKVGEGGRRSRHSIVIVELMNTVLSRLSVLTAFLLFFATSITTFAQDQGGASSSGGGSSVTTAPSSSGSSGSSVEHSHSSTTTTTTTGVDVPQDSNTWMTLRA